MNSRWSAWPTDMSDCGIAVSSAQGFGGDEMTADPDDGDAGHSFRNVHDVRCR
jgi:hypothetical protein